MISKKPNWADWRVVPRVSLVEAVALSLDIDPEYVSGTSSKTVAASLEWREFRSRLKVLERCFDSSAPRPYGGDRKVQTISLRIFANWACTEAEWSGPPELRTIATELSRKELNARIETLEAEVQKLRSRSRWPWGDHNTKHLRELAAAAEQFWKLYDPSDPSTAPTNDNVVSWLTKRKVADRVAQIMAQILRADGLPSGRRK